ncbi:acylphosphatase [Candidatus Marinamargulisbacteria bacterium SCGC AG-343-D04]|nr:acylphosphatase [Candidatus Marinamargulisbacteria bacterium SCGC AG-343-D04]
MSELVTFNVRVWGHVQGVFFRQSALDKASEYGLTGWVRNMADGSVQAVIQGSPEHCARMLDWFSIGPPASEVSTINHSKIASSEQFQTFIIQ